MPYTSAKYTGQQGKNASQRIEECDVKPLRDISYFFGYFQQDLYPCENKENVGGAELTRLFGLIKFRDGDKWVCTDEGVGPTSRDCLVYSFGINYEWSFDDAMAERGCKVFAFDPTMESRDHQRSENVMFLRLGISNITGEQVIGKVIRKVARLPDIMARLGHAGHQIDYLKIDIEGMEVEVLQDLLLEDPAILASVRQIGMEIHPGIYGDEDVTQPNNLFAKFWRIFQLLDCLGFRLIHWNRNTYKRNHYIWKGRKEATCYEVVYVRIVDASGMSLEGEGMFFVAMKWHLERTTSSIRSFVYWQEVDNLESVKYLQEYELLALEQEKDNHDEDGLIEVQGTRK
ncbi:probable methyltransferase-like protein 24 [Penaeus chinensis]|uniref:probable methyltransferase-like protein 24 n=1 Tax=Penaeus chinensis TaxID=139456 RepID=UPI001FB7B6C4|nr:probable methyltransferase-like protein 24 [Penaeus chinensis]